MMEPLSFNFENIEALAAAAFARSRVCATALREDVVPNLEPRERRGAERLISAIDRRRIFDEEPVIELDVLIENVSRLIVSGATQTEHFIADECHIEGGATLTHTQHSAEAEGLARALPLLLELQEAVLGVHDLMHAERALEKLRHRI